MDCAKRTWENIRDGIATVIVLGENTLTENNLLEIQRRHPDEVRLFKFDQIREGTETGADWEWWLTNHRQNKWMGLRVQAKKLNCDKLTYDAINHRTQKNGPQINLLISNANDNGLVPLYCFYNYFPAQNQTTFLSRCGSYREPTELMGCTLASAQGVNRIRPLKHRKQLAKLEGKCLPWHCLVCCEGFARPTQRLDLVDRAAAVLNSILDIDHDGINIREQPPAYIRDMMESWFLKRTDRLVGSPLPDRPQGISHVMVTVDSQNL